MNLHPEPMPAPFSSQSAFIDECSQPSCVIVGLGNCLLCDDGVGVHAVRKLMSEIPEDALAVEVGVDVFSAIPWLERAPRVLAIDAMDAGGLPGTIYRCGASDIQVVGVRASLHELGLLAILEFIPKPRWPEIHILGVQPGTIAYGMEMTAALQAALPQVVSVAREIVKSWHEIPRPKTAVRRASQHPIAA